MWHWHWVVDFFSTAQHGDFLAGWVCAVISIGLAKFIFRLYGLDHAILNLDPPETMWMNMGYWDHARTFPDACVALLRKVLEAADLLDEDGYPVQREDRQSLRLVDVGFGCGDQTLYLTQQLSKPDIHDAPPRPLFDSYIGITLNPHQAEFARQRLQAEPSIEQTTGTRTPDIRIFCADAGNPASWNDDLHRALSSAQRGKKDPKDTGAWLLALDTLYHFKPSRRPLFSYAYENRISIMAFDLLLSDSASLYGRMVLRLVCLVASIPSSNFMTPSEYKKLLTQSGYAVERIAMEDISERVFPGLAGYMQSKEKELGRFGMTLGKYRVPAKIFAWWARSGIVRGMLVVAKR
ncbi:hypothetical protein MAP00_005295 [Monascus purpureus]|nr:hypothetical protein MAP00_005295 [Monascus purpureus]